MANITTSIRMDADIKKAATELLNDLGKQVEELPVDNISAYRYNRWRGGRDNDRKVIKETEYD